MSESADRVRDLLEHVSEALALQATVNISEEGREIRAELEGDDLGLFIGRHGQTIDAVQHLAFKTATRDHPPSAGVRVVVDAAGYRERREQALQRQADEAAADAVRSKRPVALDAMSATERKVVHEYLKDRDDVETYSEGTEPDRHLVVAPLIEAGHPLRHPDHPTSAGVSRETPGRGGSAGRGGAARAPCSSCSRSIRRPRRACATSTQAIDRHVADSLSALPWIGSPARIADLGSGAGWPGLALAAALPDAHVWLVDSAIRHCRYLERAVEVSGLTNVTVVNSRIEEWRGDGRRRHRPRARLAAGGARVRRPAARRGRHADRLEGRGERRGGRGRRRPRPRSSACRRPRSTRSCRTRARATTRCTCSARSRPRPSASRGAAGMAVKRPLGASDFRRTRVTRHG